MLVADSETSFIGGKIVQLVSSKRSHASLVSTGLSPLD